MREHVKLKVKDALEEGAYKIQISSDNAFFNTLATIVCNATLDELTSEIKEDSYNKIYNLLKEYNNNSCSSFGC